MSAWSRREFLRGSLVAGTGLAAGIGFPKILTAQGREPIKVGILHSLSGTMAISEAPIKEVVLMAIGEINKAGGVLGRKVEPVVEDPASNWDLFAEKSKKLLLQDKVATVFGCWTSVSRKSVLPVFEKNNGLLFYPVQYEGEECSKNVIYTGATINQQATPGVDYLMSPEGGGKKKFYLLGSDYVYPRTTNKILRLYLTKVKKVPESAIAEEYTPFHHQDYQTIVGKIKSFSAAGDAAVINTINGDSNVPFFKELANQCVTDDPMMHAYIHVHLWAKAVQKAESTDVEKVLKALEGLEIPSPVGKYKVDEKNHHTWKPVYIGKIREDGQFDVVWKTKSWVRPAPWSEVTYPGRDCDWSNGGKGSFDVVGGKRMWLSDKS